jgi:hypothetical protein
MPRTVLAACALPITHSDIPLGNYGDLDRGGLAVVAMPVENSPESRATGAVIHFEIPESLNSADAERKRTREADRLFLLLNRLIRWCRTLSDNPALHELTLGRIGIVRFIINDGTNEDWGVIVGSGERFHPFRPSLSEVAAQIQLRFASGDEPPVSALFLSDARQALMEGRFRESILFCWSVIDATFNQKFDALVKQKLHDEWRESREFLMGPDFGLRHKMGIGLRLVAGRSFFQEDDNFWGALDRSYKSRNKIIHEGAVATESDARLSISVAQRVIQIMNEIQDICL